MRTWFWWGNLREIDHLENTGVDGSSRRGIGGMDWIVLTQDRNRCRALVNAVMNIRAP